MADKTIGSLPAIESLDDESLFIAEQQGEAVKVTGLQFKTLARVGVAEYVESAQTASENALAAAQQAQEAVASVEGAAEEAAAAQAANEAAQAAMQAAETAKESAESAAQSAANDATQNVLTNMESYVSAAQSAQTAAEAARDQAQAIAGGDFLPLAGGTLTGPLVLSGEPTQDLHAANKKYVDAAVATAKPKAIPVTLTAAGWDAISLTQTAAVPGVLADETAQLIQLMPSATSQTAYIEAGILCTGQVADSLTFTATTVPTEDLTVYVVIQEVTA